MTTAALFGSNVGRVTWSTVDLAAMLGRRSTNDVYRLVPHSLGHPGSGNRHRLNRADVAAALIWHALDPRHHVSRPHPAEWRRHTASELGRVFAAVTPSLFPWVVCWPDGWFSVAPDPAALVAALHPARADLVAVLFLDLILRPLNPEPMP